MQRIFLLICGVSIFFLLFLPNVDAQTGIYSVPILLEPTNGQKLGREAVTFRWEWEGEELAENEYFCVEMWKSQMKPTSAPLRLTKRSTSLSVPVVDLSPGDYQWRVTVVRVVNRCPEEELSQPSETWSFSWNQTILMWVKKNIIVVSLCATVILSMVAVTLRKYFNEKWKDWERIIDKAIDNALLEEIYNVLPYVSHVKLPILVKDDSIDGIPKAFRKHALRRYYREHRGEDRLDHLLEKHGDIVFVLLMTE